MYVITYSLKDRDLKSGHYYSTASLFTDEVLAEGFRLAGSIVESYRSYCRERQLKENPSAEEYILEFLILGILWKVYSGDALDLEKLPQQVMTGLKNLRNQNIVLKPGIDFLRGIFSTLFLSPDLYDHLDILNPTLLNLQKLIKWLEATGEFDQEAKRLGLWHGYFTTLDHETCGNHLATALTFALWFEGRSEIVLGRYTENVERYLNEIRPTRYWHEDVIFCGRRRVEYHMNMVGAEIMNRAFRQDFLKTRKKLLLLPACMRLLPENKCRAESSGFDFQCAGCSKSCSINILTRMGKKHGFRVAMVSHESSISARKKDPGFLSPDTGVIGVACVLNLISGGWMLKEMGIPAQCVLLDYCGCKNHWHDEGMPTEISLAQLEKVLGI